MEVHILTITVKPEVCLTISGNSGMASGVLYTQLWEAGRQSDDSQLPQSPPAATRAALQLTSFVKSNVSRSRHQYS
jgi:hypothetical protein